jgi:hypothetical protein
VTPSGGKRAPRGSGPTGAPRGSGPTGAPRGSGPARAARGIGSARRLGTPKPTSVIQGEGGSPRNIAGRDVDCVREEWVVEDRWWTGRPLRRRYFEVVLLDGRNVVVFHDLVGGGWFLQRS